MSVGLEQRAASEAAPSGTLFDMRGLTPHEVAARRDGVLHQIQELLGCLGVEGLVHVRDYIDAEAIAADEGSDV